MVLRSGAQLANPWLRAGAMAMSNKRVRSGAYKAARYSVRTAGEAIGRAWRSYQARKSGNTRAVPGVASRSGRSVGAGNGGSATHGGTRSYGSRRKSMYRKGRGTRRGKSYGRRGRRGRGKGNSGMSTSRLLSHFKKMICTPQVTKVNFARNYANAGWGVRSYGINLVNSKDNLSDMWAHRQGVYFTNTSTNPAAPTTQTQLGQPHKCCLTSFHDVVILQNRSNWDMELKVYECIVRKKKSFTLSSGDMYVYVTGRFTESDTNMDNRGVLQPTYTGTDYLTDVWKNVGYTPYMSSHFCSQFRIIKTSSYKIAMNDYVKYHIRVNPIKFSGPDIEAIGNSAGFQENIGGWSKVMIYTWVGGPIDNETVGGADPSRQTKAKCDLFTQTTREYKYYFEPRADLLYNISSSNATGSQLGFETINTYNTRSDSTGMVCPATSVDQTVTGADDVPNLAP